MKDTPLLNMILWISICYIFGFMSMGVNSYPVGQENHNIPNEESTILSHPSYEEIIQGKSDQPQSLEELR